MKRLRKKRVTCQKSRSTGFTLVEMMVAMLIGIFLSLALTGLYVAIKWNFLGEDSIVSAQENQRLALNQLTNSIQSAGYIVDPVNQDVVSVFSADSTFLKAGQIIYGATNDKKESISVRYQTANGDRILNCAGAENESGSNVIFTNTFSISDKNELICSASIDGAAAKSVVLSKNISNIAFQYAVDTNSDGIIDSYLTSSQVAAVGWNLVHGVRIDLTMVDTISSPESAQKAMPKALTQYVNLMNTYEVPN